MTDGRRGKAQWCEECEMLGGWVKGWRSKWCCSDNTTSNLEERIITLFGGWIHSERLRVDLSPATAGCPSGARGAARVEPDPWLGLGLGFGLGLGRLPSDLLSPDLI